MPKVSIINSLKEELREEIDKRLRESGYGNLIGLCQWLSETHGIKISKTSMGVYSKDRKIKDRTANLIDKEAGGSLAGKQTVDLLVELGTLRVREHRIMKRLEQIGFIDPKKIG